jgi:hypothetical protein
MQQPIEPTLRPDQFSIDIASGVLVSLGVNMYTSIGKSLAEFVANAYDADASQVEIAIPFAEIEKQRTAIREAAKAEVAAKKRDKFTMLSDPLSETVKIVIKDNGHGMSPSDIESKFLVVSRNRREGDAKSESGKRNVMGRKGLGKLAGFGTAEKITIWSKREGETFATEFTMDYGLIAKQEKVHESYFAAKYHDGLPAGEKGTVVTLTALRCDSLKASAATVQDILAQNFAIQGDSFDVYLNGTKVEEPPAEYEYEYPEGGAGIEKVKVVAGDFEFDVLYVVKFRAREAEEGTPPKTDDKGRSLARGSLPTSLRGARIYCNGRLAAGPSMFKLHTGMHNFHSQAYMECIVHADDIDRQAIDHIGTNRAELKGDSDIVEALKDAVTEIMRKALYQHSKFRDAKIEEQVEQDGFTQALMIRVRESSKEIQVSTKKLLATLAKSEGVASPFYKQAAPLVLESMNAGEVLAKLIELEIDPKSLVVVAQELFELSRVENRDALKLYRARKHGIEAVRKLADHARTNWKKGAKFEIDLHRTLKENPWLIKPEFSRYLTSDKPLADVAKEISSLLEIDAEAPELSCDADGNIKDEDSRPDLVFAMFNGSVPGLVNIVELKTPNYPLRIEHLQQLQGYILRVKEWLKGKYSGPILVRGFLIGDVDPESKSLSVKLLNDEKSKVGPQSEIEIISLPELLERAKRVHTDAIDAYEKTEEFFREELSTDRPVATTEAQKEESTTAVLAETLLVDEEAKKAVKPSQANIKAAPAINMKAATAVKKG